MYVQEEAEVPDDEQLNDMIARNEDEMELFTVSVHVCSLCFLCILMECDCKTINVSMLALR